MITYILFCLIQWFGKSDLQSAPDNTRGSNQDTASARNIDEYPLGAELMPYVAISG